MAEPASPGGVGIRRFDHVAIAVHDLERAVGLYIDALGGEFILGADNDDTGIRIMHIRLGGFKIELMQSLRDDSLLAPFLERRGEGFHHVTFVVDDLPVTLDALELAGFPVTGTDLANPAWAETFLSPRVTGGPLLQFCSTVRNWTEGVDGMAARDVIAGRIVFDDAWPRWRDSDEEGAHVD